jgi:hypothetical protein
MAIRSTAMPIVHNGAGVKGHRADPADNLTAQGLK